MTKLKNTDIDILNIINKMSNNDLEAILYGVNSEIPILNLNAVIFGTKFSLKRTEFIEAMQNTLINSDVKFFGMKLNEFVTASLHLLDVQEYVGDNNTIKRLIKSNFDF